MIERVEIPLQYLGKVQAYNEAEFYGDKEMMENYTAERYNYGYEEWAGYHAFLESDMEEPYQSGIIYVYEMNKIDLATTQF